MINARLKLTDNPFLPGGTVPELKQDEVLYVPRSIRTKLDDQIMSFQTNLMDFKALSVIGDYGSGKSTILSQFVTRVLREKNYKVFYFSNPGIQFYDLANTLLRGIGRAEFAKGLFELVSFGLLKGTIHQFVSDEDKKGLLTFSEWIQQAKNKEQKRRMVSNLQASIRNSEYKITSDDEIAHKLATMIVETRDRTYFDYRDFVSGRDSYIAEKEEPKYFKALIRSLKEIYHARGIVFIIDEFEDIVSSIRMPVFKQTEYLRTLKHLIDLSKEEDFWLVLGLTPKSSLALKPYDEALYQRIGEPSSLFSIFLGKLDKEDIYEIVKFYINRGRQDGVLSAPSAIFPFPEDFGDIVLEENPILTPRQLVKLCFFLVAKASVDESILVPFTRSYTMNTLRELYPKEAKYE